MLLISVKQQQQSLFQQQQQPQQQQFISYSLQKSLSQLL